MVQMELLGSMHFMLSSGGSVLRTVSVVVVVTPRASQTSLDIEKEIFHHLLTTGVDVTVAVTVGVYYV